MEKFEFRTFLAYFQNLSIQTSKQFIKVKVYFNHLIANVKISVTILQDSNYDFGILDSFDYSQLRENAFKLFAKADATTMLSPRKLFCRLGYDPATVKVVSLSLRFWNFRLCRAIFYDGYTEIRSIFKKFSPFSRALKNI